MGVEVPLRIVDSDSAGAGIAVALNGLLRIEGGAVSGNRITTRDGLPGQNPSAGLFWFALPGGIDVEGTDFGAGTTDNEPSDVGVRTTWSPVLVGTGEHDGIATFYCDATVGCVAECLSGCRVGVRCSSGSSCASGACTMGRCE